MSFGRTHNRPYPHAISLSFSIRPLCSACRPVTLTVPYPLPARRTTCPPLAVDEPTRCYNPLRLFLHNPVPKPPPSHKRTRNPQQVSLLPFSSLFAMIFFVLLYFENKNTTILFSQSKNISIFATAFKGRLAEWLGTGLQNRLQRFESATALQTCQETTPFVVPSLFLLRFISS